MVKKPKSQDERELEQLAKKLLSMPHKPREEMAGKRRRSQSKGKTASPERGRR